MCTASRTRTSVAESAESRSCVSLPGLLKASHTVIANHQDFCRGCRTATKGAAHLDRSHNHGHSSKNAKITERFRNDCSQFHNEEARTPLTIR